MLVVMLIFDVLVEYNVSGSIDVKNKENLIKSYSTNLCFLQRFQFHSSHCLFVCLCVCLFVCLFVGLLCKFVRVLYRLFLEGLIKKYTFCELCMV